MTWHSPFMLLLFIPLLIAVANNFYYHKRKNGALPLSTLSIAKEVSPGLRVRLKNLPDLLKYLGLALMIIALARPQKADEKVNRNVEGIDIIICLDISHSMLIEDMKPIDRLVSSKKIITEFISKRISDRIGFVVFSGESYTRVPLTLDYDLLKASVEEVQPTTNIKMGTAIGVGLATSVSRLKESDAKSRVVILLTDGENNTGLIDPETALKIAKGYGIKIYTVGMGKNGQAQLPVYSTDVLGRKVKRYQPIHSKVNDELLTKLAVETGGKYFRAETTSDLQKGFEEINNLEKTKIEETRFTQYSELFMVFLIWAFVFYGLGVFLQTTILRRGV